MNRTETLIVVAALILTVFTAFKSAFPGPFECGTIAVCNLHTSEIDTLGDQYCSHDPEPRCKFCKDEEYTCFTEEAKFNCTRHCLAVRDRKRDQERDKERDQPCKPLPNITYGFINVPTITKPGDRAKIGCLQGYHLNGSYSLTCLPFGIWSDNLPTCEENRCSKPTIEHGMVLGTDTVYDQGSKLAYHCNIGYLALSSEAICAPNTTWLNLACIKEEEDTFYIKGSMCAVLCLICTCLGFVMGAVSYYCWSKKNLRNSYSSSSVSSELKQDETYLKMIDKEENSLDMPPLNPDTDLTPQNTRLQHTHDFQPGLSSSVMQSISGNRMDQTLSAPNTPTKPLTLNVSIESHFHAPSGTTYNEAHEERGFHDRPSDPKFPTQATAGNDIPSTPNNDHSLAEVDQNDGDFDSSENSPLIDVDTSEVMNGTDPLHDDDHMCQPLNGQPGGKIALQNVTAALDDLDGDTAITEQKNIYDKRHQRLIYTKINDVVPVLSDQPNDQTKYGKIALPNSTPDTDDLKGLNNKEDIHAQPRDTRKEEKIALGSNTPDMDDF